MTKEINEIPVRFLSTIFEQLNSPWTESISPWWTDAHEGSGESMPGEEFHAREFPRLEYHFYEISIEGEGGKLTRWPSLFPGVEWTALNAMTSFPTSFPVPGAASYPSSVPLTRNFSWIEGRSFIPSHSTDYEWIFCIRVARHWKKFWTPYETRCALSTPVSLISMGQLILFNYGESFSSVSVKFLTSLLTLDWYYGTIDNYNVR